MINNDPDPFDGVTVFLEVADALSFRSAATSLGVTPAAVSRTIQKLEDRVGAKLFERTTRTVRLTAEGSRFADRCREARFQVRIGRTELADARRSPSGVLVVSASPILARLVVGRLARFRVRHPAIHVDLRLTDRVVRFAEDDAEVALRVGPPSDESVVAIALLETRWTTVASPAYLARRGEPRVVADLADHDRLRFAAPRARARPFVFVDPKTGATITYPGDAPALEVDHGDLLVDAAKAGVGIAQVLDYMVEGELASGDLVLVLPDARAKGPTIHAVFPKRSLPRVRAFVDFLAGELRPPRSSY